MKAEYVLNLGEREVKNLEGNLKELKKRGGQTEFLKMTDGWMEAIADLIHDWRVMKKTTP